MFFNLNVIILKFQQEVERKAKGRTGWPPDVWATELKKKFNDNNNPKSLNCFISNKIKNEEIHIRHSSNYTYSTDENHSNLLNDNCAQQY